MLPINAARPTSFDPIAASRINFDILPGSGSFHTTKPNGGGGKSRIIGTATSATRRLRTMLPVTSEMDPEIRTRC